MGKDPDEFNENLGKKHGYFLKGVGDPNYHIGGNFERDADGTLTWDAQTYITKMLDNCVRQFGALPKKK